MTWPLPASVRSYLEASTSAAAGRVSALFAPDGTVHDEHRLHADLDFAVWYAHTNVTRSNDVQLTLAGSTASWVTSTVLNSSRSGGGGATGSGIAVTAGDLLTLTFAKTAAQQYGSLTGLALSFAFNAAATTPIPAALPLFVSALAGLGWAARRRRQAGA